MFIPSQLTLKRLAACCGVVSLLFAVPVTVMAEESSALQVLLAQQPSELDQLEQMIQGVNQLIQGLEEIGAGNFEAGATLLKQALPIFQQIFSSEHPLIQGIEQFLEIVELAETPPVEQVKAEFEKAKLPQLIRLLKQMAKGFEQMLQAVKQIEAGNVEAGIALLEQTRSIFQQTLGSEHPSVQALDQLLQGVKLAQAGKIEEAKAALEQANALFKKAG